MTPGNAVCTDSNGAIVSKDGILGGNTCNGSPTGTSTGNISGVNDLTASGKIKTNKLTVEKNAKVKGDLTVEGATETNGLTNAGDITNSGNIQTNTLKTTGKATLSSLDVTNGAVVGGTLNVNGLTTTNDLTNNGLLINNGDVVVNGTTWSGRVNTFQVNAGQVNAGQVNAFESNAFVSNSVFANNFVTNSAFVNAGVVNAGVVNSKYVNAYDIDATFVNAHVINSKYVNAYDVDAGYMNVSHGLTVAPGAYVDMGHNVVHGVDDPIGDYDAANKRYVDTGLSAAFKEIDRNAQGIAIAMAMAGLTLPDDKTFTLGANVGFFEDKQAIAVQGAIRLTPNVILNGGIGTGFQGTDTVGGRVGVSAAW